MRGNFDRARELYRHSRASLEELGCLLLGALTSLDSSAIELLAGDLAAAERSCGPTTGGLRRWASELHLDHGRPAADVLDRQAHYDESAEFAGVCEHVASPDDVGPQFRWRCVRGKRGPGRGPSTRPKSLLSAATALIETSDERLAGTGCWISPRSGSWPEPRQTPRLAARKPPGSSTARKLVSARIARQLAERLCSTAVTS